MASIQDSFALIERQYGLPSGYLARLWQIESASGKAMSTPLSSAKGHFAFTNATAKQYGLKDPNNLIESATAAAKLASDNAKILKSRGIPVTGPTLYMAHQQGAGGASSVLSDPSSLAANATSLRAVRNNLPSSMRSAAGTMTSGQFSDFWKNKYLGITPSKEALAASTAGAAPAAAAPAATPGALESIGSGLNYLARNGLGTIANTIAGREVVTPMEVPAAAAATAKTPAQAGYGMASSLAGLAQLAAASERKPAMMQPVYNKAARGGTNVNLAGIMGSPQDDELKRLMGLLGGGGGGYLE